MTKAQAKKLLDDPNASVEEHVRAYKKIHPPWELMDCVMFCQLCLSRLDPLGEKWDHYSLQLVKEIRATLQVIEDKGKADKIEIHNHIHKPEGK